MGLNILFQLLVETKTYCELKSFFFFLVENANINLKMVDIRYIFKNWICVWNEPIFCAILSITEEKQKKKKLIAAQQPQLLQWNWASWAHILHSTKKKIVRSVGLMTTDLETSQYHISWICLAYKYRLLSFNETDSICFYFGTSFGGCRLVHHQV